MLAARKDTSKYAWEGYGEPCDVTSLSLSMPATNEVRTGAAAATTLLTRSRLTPVGAGASSLSPYGGRTATKTTMWETLDSRGGMDDLLLLAEVLDEARRERLGPLERQPQRAVPEDLAESPNGPRHAEEDRVVLVLREAVVPQ